MRHGLALIMISILVLVVGCQTDPTGRTDLKDGLTELTGDYLGQPTPGLEPVLFAPGTVSRGLAERDLAMTPDGGEIYFGVNVGNFTLATILVSRKIGDRWSDPEVAPFAGTYADIEPAIAPDGSRFYFVSNRPLPGENDRSSDENIWVMDRLGDGWSEARPVGPPVNSNAPEFFPSLTRDGTIYFTRRGEDGAEYIYRARPSDDGFGEPEKLGPEVNSGRSQFNACVAPDESYVIVPVFGREDSLGGVDYYVAFRSADDTWQGPFNLGPSVNAERGQEWSPSISPDGRFFFFMSSRTLVEDRIAPEPMTAAGLRAFNDRPMNGHSDIWWVDAAIIEQLRPDDA